MCKLQFHSITHQYQPRTAKVEQISFREISSKYALRHAHYFEASVAKKTTRALLLKCNNVLVH